jgi:DNA repair exonuclease SbcCD ATPase subunit
MSKRIEKLKVKNFRGATTLLDLDFDKKPMVMIFGENGTGKSSIVDAMDFICNQKYGSIEERSSVKKKTHSPSIGKTKNDIEINLRFGGSDYRANHSGSEPVTTPPGFPSANILRRSKIVELIAAQPNKRFEALEKFLTVTNIEKCEITLGDAVRNKRTEYEKSTSALMEAKVQLEELKNKLTESKKSTEEWAKEITEIDETKLQQIVNNAEEIERFQEKLSTTYDSLISAKTILKEKTDFETAASQKLKSFQEREATNKDDLLELLKKAKCFIEKHSNIEICPVCEQNIVNKNVIDRLTQRLKKMEELGELITELDNAKKSKEFQESVLKTREKDYYDCAKNLVNKIRGQKQDAEGSSDLLFDYDKLIAEITTWDDTQEIQKAKEELEKYKTYKASLEEKKKTAQAQQKQQMAIKTMLEAIKAKEQEAQKDSEILKRLKEYEEIVTKERKQYVDNILQTVSGEVERLYRKIHPDEGVGGFRLYLKEKAKGSLEYDGDFQNKHNIPPQAYYSDSHLDTLGICMFLALTKHFNDDNTIVILDDIVTSVDEAHRERFLEMLHDEADNFCHMVVTTHYRPWRDIYRIGGGPANKVQFIDLQLWSKEAGIRHSKSRLMAEELKSLKDNITVENRQNIASKAGILLEGILDSLALRYKLKVPRMALPKYELQELFNAMCKGKKHIKIIQTEDNGNKSEMPIESLVEDLEKIKWIRNQVGCHWNLDGSLVSDTEIKEFAEKTIGLSELLCCHKCGSLPIRDSKYGNYFQCQCGEKQMYPLKMP